MNGWSFKRRGYVVALNPSSTNSHRLNGKICLEHILAECANNILPFRSGSSRLHSLNEFISKLNRFEFNWFEFSLPRPHSRSNHRESISMGNKTFVEFEVGATSSQYPLHKLLTRRLGWKLFDGFHLLQTNRLRANIMTCLWGRDAALLYLSLPRSNKWRKEYAGSPEGRLYMEFMAHAWWGAMTLRGLPLCRVNYFSSPTFIVRAFFVDVSCRTKRLLIV